MFVVPLHSLNVTLILILFCDVKIIFSVLCYVLEPVEYSQFGQIKSNPLPSDWCGVRGGHRGCVK